MHTHDMENHDNLYADEMPMRRGESSADARGHAIRAMAALLVMLAVLGGLASLNGWGPFG